MGSASADCGYKLRLLKWGLTCALVWGFPRTSTASRKQQMEKHPSWLSPPAIAMLSKDILALGGPLSPAGLSAKLCQTPEHRALVALRYRAAREKK